ncbi:hypothetical protein KZC51_05580 [Microbacterium sp. SSW1-49]|uniref:Uncharacterized protein n=1 Tax=Microbacterium croceum TaxID=2851645 RepID=A0ABT0FC28_9MICO|nr:hypothetical protein [Microbacterium croceum]MCK2035606.1 hypothetical protein [Microbacterium croceum]
MTRARTARSLAIAIALLGGVALAGCAPEGATSAPTPSAGQSSDTPAPTATPTVAESAEPTRKPQTPVALTQGELLQICIDATTPQFDPDVRFDDTRARIEERTVSPEWLVLIPVQTNGYDGQAACTIGGSAADPDIGMASASIQVLSEEQIQKIIRGEDDGTDG